MTNKKLLHKFIFYKNLYHNSFNNNLVNVLEYKKQYLINLRFSLNVLSDRTKQNKTLLFHSKKEIIKTFEESQKEKYKKLLIDFETLFYNFCDVEKTEKNRNEFINKFGFMFLENQKTENIKNMNIFTHKDFINLYGKFDYKGNIKPFNLGEIPIHNIKTSKEKKKNMSIENIKLKKEINEKQIINHYYKLEIMRENLKHNETTIKSFLNSPNFENNLISIKEQLKKTIYFLKRDSNKNYKNLPFIDICNNYDFKQFENNKTTKNINVLINAFSRYQYKKDSYKLDFDKYDNDKIKIIADFDGFLNCLKRFNIFNIYDVEHIKNKKSELLKELRKDKKRKEKNIIRDGFKIALNS